MKPLYATVMLSLAGSILAGAQEVEPCPGVAFTQPGIPANRDATEPRWTEADALRSSDEALSGAGYPLTKGGFLSALHDSKAPVRAAAAEKLLLTGKADVVPMIMEALSSERDACTRFKMLGDLSMLGGTLLSASRAPGDDAVREQPFQSCTASESKVLSLTLEQIEPRYRQNPVPMDPVVRVSLRNLTSGPIGVPRPGYPTELFSATVLDPGGKRPDMPEANAWMYQPSRERDRPRADGTIVVHGTSGSGLAPLQPGQETSWDWHIGQDFTLSTPGTYRVSLGGRIAYLNTTVCSNTIDVTVK